MQEIDIRNNILKNSKGIDMHLVVGEPIVEVRNNALSDSEELEVTGDQEYTVENQWKMNPHFVEGSSYTLKDDSPLKNKGTDGKDLGILPN